ncbi:MAG TPA: response regulator [Sphingobium sp.]|uniref:response regulator n=1 Tax=Sphingobium sp. TaxID=1912891 RepID=UPI002ED4218F
MDISPPPLPGQDDCAISSRTASGGRGEASLDLNSHILVVDDDPEIRTLLEEFLGSHGYSVSGAANGVEMDARLAERPFDLAVIDVMMPGEDGLSILRRLRATIRMPVIMLSAVGSDIDRIIGLEMGADDYLAKPCNPRELLARIRVALRRAREAESLAAGPAVPQERAVYQFEGWTIDMDERLLIDPDDVLISLTDGEFRLLRAFVLRPRRVLSRDQLLDYSAGSDTESYDRAIDVQISRLRRKLHHGRSGDIIRTVRSEGYLFTSQVRRAPGTE